MPSTVWVKERGQFSQTRKTQAERAANAIVTELARIGMLASNSSHAPGSIGYCERRDDVAKMVLDFSYEQATDRMGESQYSDKGHDLWEAFREEIEWRVFNKTGEYADATYEFEGVLRMNNESLSHEELCSRCHIYQVVEGEAWCHVCQAKYPTTFNEEND